MRMGSGFEIRRRGFSFFTSFSITCVSLAAPIIPLSFSRLPGLILNFSFRSRIYRYMRDAAVSHFVTGVDFFFFVSVFRGRDYFASDRGRFNSSVSRDVNVYRMRENASSSRLQKKEVCKCLGKVGRLTYLITSPLLHFWEAGVWSDSDMNSVKIDSEWIDKCAHFLFPNYSTEFHERVIKSSFSPFSEKKSSFFLPSLIGEIESGVEGGKIFYGKTPSG